MVMNESVENYLETILVLNHRLGNVRSIDIANEMNFKKPSVSVAMKNLRENGFITVSPEGYIHLTESGREVAVSAESFEAIKRHINSVSK